MIECETKLKTWGNSIGIVIPKGKIKEEHLKANQNVRVFISSTKVTKVRDIFGLLKNWKRPTDDIMKEVDNELNSRFFKR